MRILVVHPGAPLSQHDVWQGWVKALRKLGHEIVHYRADDFLLRYRQWPPTERSVLMMQTDFLNFERRAEVDFVLFVGTFFMSPEVLTSMVHPAVLLHSESPYEDCRQLKLAPHAAANMISDPTNLADYEAAGTVHLFSAAYDPEIHYPSDEVKDIDFTFIGTALPSRIAFFGSMNLVGIDACIDGGGWFAQNGIDNKDAADLYRRTRVGVNFYRREGDTADGWAVGPRELEMAACGLFFLRDPRGEGDELFDMLPTFTSPEEAREELNWYLGHASAREERAKLAAEAVKDRTFDCQAVKAMNFIKEIL